MARGNDLYAMMAGFFALSAEDPRIRTVHISLYLALLNEWQIKSFINPVEVKRPDIMKAAKLRSRYTYNIAINDLQAYGYIRYLPSADPRVQSEVWFE